MLNLKLDVMLISERERCPVKVSPPDTRNDVRIGLQCCAKVIATLVYRQHGDFFIASSRADTLSKLADISSVNFCREIGQS